MKRWNHISKSHAPAGGSNLKSFGFAQDRSQKLKEEEIINILLQNRGLKTNKQIKEFLNPQLANITLESVGIDIDNVKKALKRIKKAIERNEKIVIFGDYDVDGICGTAILWETIYSFYENVTPYIPSRVDEGYGLSIAGISNIKDQKSKIRDASLIITVDNGIVANEAVNYANKQGIDVIITDHHEMPKNSPDAYSIIHTTKICGAGIAYLLAQKIPNSKFQISNKNQNSELKKENNHLELAALATVSDLMPLTCANRILVKYGLEKLRKTRRIGLLALFRETRISQENLGVYEIGYIIGPRLNAMGRLSSAMDSLRLICAKDRDKAFSCALRLGKTNRERQILTEETVEHAKFQISNFKFPTSNIIFVSHKTYNQGVIGLVASKLTDEYYKPSFVLSVGEKYAKGSARSIAGVNIIELIRTISSSLIVDAGGHQMAAGFTIEINKIEAFKKELEKLADKKINARLLKRTINIDLWLCLAQINYELYEKIQTLSPFGIGNPEPIFASKKVIIEDMKLVGVDNKHLKLLLSQEGNIVNAIAFGFGKLAKELHIDDEIDIAYTIDKDKWNGNKKLQLKIKDIKNQCKSNAD